MPTTPQKAAKTAKKPAPIVAPPHIAPSAAPAIEAVPCSLVLLGPTGPMQVDAATTLAPPTLFALVPTSPVARRYLFLIQEERDPDTRFLVLMSVFDTHDAAPLRVPALGGWQRAVVTGPVALLASDAALSRAELAAFRGGHEPPPTKARPPFI